MANIEIVKNMNESCLQILPDADTFDNFRLNTVTILTLPIYYIEYFKYGITGLFILALLVQLLYYYLVFLRVPAFRRNVHTKKHPISVIICARNEADNLQNNLTSVLEQKHKDYEVIVVNDCSTDETDEVIGEYLKKYKHLRTTTISPDKKFTHGKKLAITVGIKAASHEWLVFTDADCKIKSDQWLNRLQENFSENKEIVLGYGGYARRKGLLNAYIRYDTLFIAMQYLGFALSGMPYMGVGRNLAYRKSLFFRNKGFASHYGILSGDDDLFVNETANKSNTVVEFHPQSHTVSVPKQSWRMWSQQKKRHFSTAKHYRDSNIFWLGLEPFSRFLFYLLFGVLLGLNIFTIFVLGAFGFRFISQMVIVKLTMIRFKEKGSLLAWIIFDIISMFINFSIYLSGVFSRSKKLRWK